MKTIFFTLICAVSLTACENRGNNVTETTQSGTMASSPAGQSGVQDPASQKNVVQVAMGSKDHSTLVKAIQAAGLVDALSNAGPFTVFAPTNAAFDKLPAGTLDDLLKPAKKADLENILQYHVSIGRYQAGQLQDGQTLGQVNGGNITISVKDGKTMVNGTAAIISSIPASNGIIHVVDAVLLPPTAK